MFINKGNGILVKIDEKTGKEELVARFKTDEMKQSLGTIAKNLTILEKEKRQTKEPDKPYGEEYDLNKAKNINHRF